MARGPRKRGRPTPPKRVIREPLEAYDDDEEDIRDTPEYKRRQLITRIGTSILLFAFLGTSGITCIASSMAEKPVAPDPATGGNQTTQDPVKMEIARFREELKKDPSDTTTMGLLGVYLMEQARNQPQADAEKSLAEARQHFEAVLQKEPDNFQMYQYLGGIYGEKNELAKAKEVFSKAVELTTQPVDPKDPEKDAKQSQRDQGQVESRVGLALVAYKEKQYDEALKQLDASLKINPGYAKGYILRAKVQIERKQPEQARRDLQLAMEIAATKPQGSPEQAEIFQDYAEGMKILDPKPTASGTPKPAAGTPTPTQEPGTSNPFTPTPQPTSPANATNAINVTTPGNTTTP